MRQKILMVPEGNLYLAFRLLPILHRAGLGVDLLCLRGDPLVHSRYVDTVFVESSPDSLFERLAGILREKERPWRAVIVAKEEVVRQLVATRDPALLENWQPGALDPLAQAFLLNKFGLETVQEHWGLPIPHCRTCHAPEQILAFGGEVGWPIIIKPPDRSGGAGVFRLNSPADLESLRPRLKRRILAQKQISGRRGVVDLLCSGGRPLAWLASYSTKREGGEFGPSTARLFTAMPSLRPLVETIAQRTRFEGFCGFDWIEEEGTGRPYLIEFHPRPPSGFRFGRFCGVDFSTSVASWLSGTPEDLTPRVQGEGPAVAAHYFSGDLSRCLRQRDWQGLKSWLPGSGACHDVFWDELPLLLIWTGLRLLARLRAKDKRPKPGAAPFVEQDWGLRLPGGTPAPD